MAQMTSAMAAKYLKKLKEEHDALQRKETKSDTFTASVQEKIEDVIICYAALFNVCRSADQPENDKFCPWTEEARLQSVHFIVYDSGYTVVWLD